MYTPTTQTLDRVGRTVERRRLIVEAHYLTATGQSCVQATRYAQGTYGHPWPDTATRILRDLQKTPPNPALTCTRVQLIDSGAKLVLSEAGTM